jgi:oligopeptide transport system substrate-binding protein
MKKFLAIVIAAVLVCGVLAGCQGGGSNKPADSGKTVFRTLHGSDVETLNYLNTGNTYDMSLAANTQDCLIEYDPLGNIKEAVATKWEVSDDQLTWTFTLRDDIKWLDYTGKEVGKLTAADFVTAAEYALNYYTDTAYMYEEARILNAHELLEQEEGVTFENVGVEAVNDTTLKFTLNKPCPYFLSCTTYGCFMPISADCLTAYYPDFANRASWTPDDWSAFSEVLDGVDYTKLWYCGSYYLSEYSPSERYVMTKNPKYWDADNIFITEVQSTYNKEADTIAPEMYLRGELEAADITSTMAKSWMADSEKKDFVHPERIQPDYSYFFSFNFNPQFDEEYEPENWKIAVNVESFRKSIFYGLNRIGAIKISDETNADVMIQNTVTPRDFCVSGGSDYVDFEAFQKLFVNDPAKTKDVYFNEEKALEYKEQAIKELTAKGATLPVKIILPYNPNVSDWDAECMYVQQQLEGLLGTDYIDIIVDQGPTQNFLSNVRRAGKFALLKTNWGCDYADPYTYLMGGPFALDNTYTFYYLSEDPDTMAIVQEFKDKCEAANALGTDDMTARYQALAEAEAVLIEHALIIPFDVSGGYTASFLNPFEAGYAPYGVTSQRYKYQHILEKPLNTEQFNAAYAQWQKDRAQAAGN